jgi:hypothetical protein
MEKGWLACGPGRTNISEELHLLCLPILDLPFEIRFRLIKLALSVPSHGATRGPKSILVGQIPGGLATAKIRHHRIH